MYRPNVTSVPRMGPSPHAPHVYVQSDLAPGDTLLAHRRKLDAAKRAQARRTKHRVLQSLLRKPTTKKG